MKMPGRCAALAVLLSAPAVLSAHAQQVIQPGCSLERTDYYQCNRDAFLHLLAVSKSIRVDTGRMDEFGHGQMVKLVDDLHKTLVQPEQRPDLVFELTWIDRTGRIDIGPADVALARLNIYAPSRGQGGRGLVWVETVAGQEDLPWPSTVVQLIRQFQKHIAQR